MRRLKYTEVSQCCVTADGPEKASNSSGALLLSPARGSQGSCVRWRAVFLVRAFLVSSKSPKRAHDCPCIPWASSDFPLLHRGLCQAWLQHTEDALRTDCHPPLHPFLRPAQQGAPSGRQGLWAHLHGAHQNATNPLEN